MFKCRGQRIDVCHFTVLTVRMTFDADADDRDVDGGTDNDENVSIAR